MSLSGQHAFVEIKLIGMPFIVRKAKNNGLDTNNYIRHPYKATTQLQYIRVQCTDSRKRAIKLS